MRTNSAAKIRTDYEETPENNALYMRLIESLPDNELIAWVGVRMGHSCGRVGRFLFPQYGLPPVSKFSIRRYLLKVHAKIANILE